MKEEDDFFHNLFEERERTPSVREEVDNKTQDVEETHATELTAPDGRKDMTEANLDTPPSISELANLPETTHQLKTTSEKTINTEFMDMQRPHKLKGVKRAPTTLNLEIPSPSLISQTEGRQKTSKTIPQEIRNR